MHTEMVSAEQRLADATLHQTTTTTTALFMPWLSNLPALRLTLAYILHDPSSLLPHATISTLLALPIPVASGLPTLAGGQQPTVKALVLDKDNTLCPPETSNVHAAYLAKIEQLKNSAEFRDNQASILIVSNTAGSTASNEHETEAKYLESILGVTVLRQQPGRKKPLCGPDVLAHFAKHGVTDNPSEIVFVGDRLATDVLVAREVGAWSYWCKAGWRDPDRPSQDYRGVVSKMEAWYEHFLRVRFHRSAPLPKYLGKNENTVSS